MHVGHRPLDELRLSAFLQRIYGLRQIKVKVGIAGYDDVKRLFVVRRCAGGSMDLRVDANEAWTPDNLEFNLAACANAGVTLVEQPLPAGKDEALARIRRPIAVCADESVHDRASLEGLRGRYDAVNIKLDKTGGLTEAVAMADSAQALGFDIMIGCMVATSLAMAPAMLLAPQARFEYFYLWTDAALYGEALAPKQGALAVPQAPGLGADPDPEVVRRYRAD